MNKIILGDSRDINHYPNNIALTITSPPYYCDKDYESDYTFRDYKDMLKSVLYNVVEKTIDGGKICINIADIAAFSKVSGKVEEYIGVSRDIQDWLREKDCYLLSRTIWAKDDPWVNSQHVAYHDKIPATYIRQLPSHEYIWTYYKKTPARKDVGSVTDYISKEEWKKFVSAVWYIRSVRANDDHPAKFPEELIRRLVCIYSVPKDMVFDPFMGSGTTAVVAHKNGRNFAGIERDSQYHALCLQNIEIAESQQPIEFIYTAPDKYKQDRAF